MESRLQTQSHTVDHALGLAFHIYTADESLTVVINS